MPEEGCTVNSPFMGEEKEETKPKIIIGKPVVLMKRKKNNNP